MTSYKSSVESGLDQVRTSPDRAFTFDLTSGWNRAQSVDEGGAQLKATVENHYKHTGATLGSALRDVFIGAIKDLGRNLTVSDADTREIVACGDDLDLISDAMDVMFDQKRKFTIGIMPQ